MDHMKNRYTFSKYIYDLHEHINEMLNKSSGLSYDDLHYAKTYLINYKVNIYLDSELIYSNVFDLKDKRVKINFTSPSLGDTISWISQVDKFQKTNNCQVFVNIKNYKDLFLESYDNLNFIEYQPTEPPKGTTLIPGMNSLSCKKFNCFFDFCQCYYAEYDLGCFLGPNEVISEFFALAPKCYMLNIEDELSIKAKGCIMSLENQKKLHREKVLSLIESYCVQKRMECVNLQNFSIFTNSNDINYRYGTMFSRYNQKQIRCVLNKRILVTEYEEIETLGESIQRVSLLPEGYAT
jgi:hypothetical protein